ncbi:MAG: VanW family protein [Firmicutes bacterium]|nr:VanW family protein [Bacillota bacterium]
MAAKKTAKKTSGKKRGKTRGKLLVFLFTTALIAVIAGGSAMGYMSYSRYADMKGVVNYDRIYDNIYINNIGVGGLTKEEALKKISQKPQEDLSGKTITVVCGAERLDLPFSGFKARLDYAPAVDAAFAYARDGSVNTRYDKITALKTTPYRITYEPEYSFDQSGLRAKIEDLARKIYVAPLDATVKRSAGVFSYTSERSGVQMDIDATVAKVKDLLTAGSGGEVTADLQTLEPLYTEAQLKQANSLLGTYSTNYKVGKNGRNTNLDVAANKINDQVVYPGQTFSTNAAMGPSTAANGWVNAPSYENGKVVDSIGGGMCQISSTLYDALLYAEMTIIERQNHSMKVGYMDYAFDATLAGDYIDLKFRNDTDLPVFIECYLKDGKVTANIYGHETRPPGRTISFSNALEATIAPGVEQITEDPGLPEGERVVDQKAVTGFRYALYKTVYQDGVQVSHEKVNTSTYKAFRAVVRVGTGPAAAGQGDAEAADGQNAADTGADTSGTVSGSDILQGADGLNPGDILDPAPPSQADQNGQDTGMNEVEVTLE